MQPPPGCCLRSGAERKESVLYERGRYGFCSYVLPELGRYVTIEDPERLLLNQIRWRR